MCRMPAVLVAAWLAGAPVILSAQVALPPVNLGGDFLDGIAGPGFLFQQFVEHYEGNGPDDGAASREGTRVRSVATLTHVAWLTGHRLLGGYSGVEALLPTANVRVRSDRTALEEWNLGDVTVAPLILQWGEAAVLGRPFWHRVDVPVTLPTGGYERSSPLNIGSGHWRVNPYWAFTILPSDDWDLSARLMYLWNGANDQPASPGVSSVRPGQAFHTNYASSYAVTRRLRIGVAGYVLQQTTWHHVDGVDLEDSRERVVALGPGIMWSSGLTKLTVHVFLETGVRNRSAGTEVLVRVANVWPEKTAAPRE